MCGVFSGCTKCCDMLQRSPLQDKGMYSPSCQEYWLLAVYSCFFLGIAITQRKLPRLWSHPIPRNCLYPMTGGRGGAKSWLGKRWRSIPAPELLLWLAFIVIAPEVNFSLHPSYFPWSLIDFALRTHLNTTLAFTSPSQVYFQGTRSKTVGGKTWLSKQYVNILWIIKVFKLLSYIQ